MKKFSSWEWALFLTPPVVILGSVILFIFLFAYSSVSAGDVIALFAPPIQEGVQSLEGNPPPTATLTPFQPLAAEFLTATAQTGTPLPQPTHTRTYTPTLTATLEFTATLLPTETPTETLTAEATVIPLTETPTLKPSAKPTRKPTHPPPLPKSASVGELVGHAQLYSLDCESRSAVDLAGFFGVKIDEREFLKRLPRSDNPEEGFVGDLNDPRGSIPPASYGVYARPVAALLQEFGLKASARKNLGWEKLKAEIAAGRPVMTWVIGNTVYGRRISYTASDGNKTIVAPYEHTVIVTGYSEDYVTILDEYHTYQRSIEAFIASWGVLGDMAITAH